MLDLAMLARRLRVNGCALRLFNPQPSARTVIGKMGLHRLPDMDLEADMELEASVRLEAGEELAAGATALAY